MINKSLKKNSIINLVKTIVGLIFPLITFPYASRVLGVEGIGKVNYANSIVSYFVLIAGLGITNYAIREGAKIREDRDRLNKFCTEMLIINIISTIIAYIGVFIIINIGIFDDYKSLILLFSLTILFNVIGVSWLFNIFEEFIYITIHTIAFQIISLICLFIFVRERSDFIAYAAVLVLSSVGANIYNLYYSRHFVHFFSGGPYELKKHIKSIMIIFGMCLASSIYLSLDVTMLGYFSGDMEVGLYSAASKINSIVCNIISSVCVVFLPRLSYYQKQGEHKKFYELTDTVLNYILILAIPASVGLVILRHECIQFISGPEFLAAASTMMIKAPNIILSIVNGFIAVQLFMPLNMEKYSLYATIAGAIINAIFNIILIPEFGADGAAIATILAEGTVFIICINVLQHNFPMKGLFSDVWKYYVASIPIVIIGVCIQFLNIGVVANLFSIFILGMLAYFISLYLLRAKRMLLLKDIMLGTLIRK